MSPLRHLSRVPAEGGLVVVVAALLASTAYDSWWESGTWIRFVEESSVPSTLLGTIGLLTAILIVGVTFAVAAMSTGSSAATVGTSLGCWRTQSCLSSSAT